MMFSRMLMYLVKNLGDACFSRSKSWLLRALRMQRVSRWVEAAARISMVRTWIVGILVLIVDSIAMRMGMVTVEAAANFLWLYCWSPSVAPEKFNASFASVLGCI